MTPEQYREAFYQENLADLRKFVEENAGHRVAISSYDRKSDLEPLARAAAELGLPLDVAKPDYSERFFDVMKSRSRRRVIWVLNLPQKNEPRSEAQNENK